MAELPEQFRPQDLRRYVTSYRNISFTAAVASAEVTKPTATKGAITNPEGRRAPKTIEPWSQSERDVESSIIETILYESSPLTGADSHTCVFPCRQHVDHVGEELVRLDSENALLLFDADTLHKPATRIVQTLLASDRIRTAVSKVVHRNMPGEDKNKGKRASLAPGRISFSTHRNTAPRPTSGFKRKREDDESDDISFTSKHRGPADVFCIYAPEPDRYAIRADSSPSPSPESNTPMEESINAARSSRQTPEEPDTTEQAPQVLYVKEAKAPHKLSTAIIDMALGAGDKVLDVGMVMERGYTCSKKLRVEESEYWFAAVCTQLYSSMFDNNVRYGIITTGVYYIFASIDTSNPSILRYSISKNTMDVQTSDLRVSPLIRLVSLTLLALLYYELPASSDVKVIKQWQCLEWVTGNQSFSTDEHREKTEATEDYKPSPGHTNSGSSPSYTSNRGCGVSAGTSEKSSEDDSQSHGPDTKPAASYPSPPLKAGTTILGKRHHQQENTPGDLDWQETEAREPKRPRHKELESVSARAPILPTTPTSSPPPPREPVARRPSISSRYCSLDCMRAVKNRSESCTDGLQADESCPNYAEHSAASQLTRSQLRTQLRHELVDLTYSEGWNYKWFNIFPEDSYTQMVKLVVKSHGYVFLGKAFQPDGSDGVQKMYREASMYDRLRHLQGICVPVCLGFIKLPRDNCLFRDGIPFTGLLLLSYAGFGMEAWPRLGLGLGDRGPVDQAFVRALSTEVQTALAQIHKAGVLHRDVALRNVLVAKATRKGPARDPEFSLKVLLIDFERSRSRSMYRHYERKRIKRKKESLPGVMSGAQDAGSNEGSADEIGNANFVKACAEELARCPRDMSQ